MNIKFSMACVDFATKHLKIQLNFTNVNDNSFKPVDAIYVKKNGKDFIICHFKNSTRTEVKPGSESFILNFECKNFPDNLKEAHFIWWNDAEKIEIENLDQDLLAILSEKNITSDFKETFETKSKNTLDAVLIPKQGGNGGVLGIITC